MVISQLIKEIEDFAPLYIQEKWDNSGFQILPEDKEVESVLLTVDVTEDVINEAITKNCNLIVSHHPLIFGGIKSITPNNQIGRIIMKAIKHKIAIYSAHTNIDQITNGVSGKLAQKLGLNNIKPLENKEFGYGVIGELSQQMTEDEFLINIKKTLNLKTIRHSEKIGKPISKVAVCGGSGASFIEDAIAQKADIYICGDLKHHDYFRAENKIILVDINHFESEQFTKEIFFELLSKKISKFAIHFSEKDKSPIHLI